MNYKGFTGSAEVSIKDNCIFGKILFINDLVTYESGSMDKIKREFQAAVDDYIATCEELNIVPYKSFSGSFNIRIGPEYHQKLALYATKKDQKINTIVKDAIGKYLAGSVSGAPDLSTNKEHLSGYGQ